MHFGCTVSGSLWLVRRRRGCMGDFHNRTHDDLAMGNGDPNPVRLERVPEGQKHFATNVGQPVVRIAGAKAQHEVSTAVHHIMSMMTCSDSGRDPVSTCGDRRIAQPAFRRCRAPADHVPFDHARLRRPGDKRCVVHG